MENLPFVIWMLGYALICTLGDYVFYVSRKMEAKDNAILLTFALRMLIWIAVGSMLYVPK